MRQLTIDPLPRSYEPCAIEQEVYRFWEEGGFFAAADASDEAPYCIVLPPPNVTGALHMGHALTATIQDMLVRWRRMQGMNALWLPGTDHAGIATQTVVERQLRSEGTSRHDIGRARFVERVWQWKEKFGGRITEQHKRLGASLDWARERFTMDEGLSRAVREAFVVLHECGRITRDNRLINWCVSCRTALSDVEVDRDKPEDGELWSFAYPLADGGEIVVATTRPETMLGDTAVAVHPDDERYRGLVGKLVRHPFQERAFPVIADPILADPTLGTGAVKVTPAHDPNDFECGRRNGLSFIDIMRDDGSLNAAGAPFEGLDRFEARRRVKEELTRMGLFRGTQVNVFAPGRCQRCRTVVEPKISLQWFVDTAEMAEAALQAVRDGRTVFVPDHQAHRYFDWLDKKLPWCISRQLWWGHRIPAWYCADCDHVTVGRDDPARCGGCSSARIRQDEDVLDTWFSSALWPFSTLGWPDRTPALATFYPTAVLETGYEIITFWVSRMMMMGLALMGDVPFRKVLLHPMVRDQDGNKMSKSRGNVIDPMDVIEGIALDALIAKTRGYTLPEPEIESAVRYNREHFPRGFPECGTDALRFTLAAYTGQDQDIRFSVDRVEGYRKFCNKIWQATLGFALPHLADMEVGPGVPEPATLADRWILARLADVAREVNENLEAFHVGEATNLLYHFFWDELCSWYIELLKPVFAGDDDAEKAAGKAVLRHVLDAALRLMHPFMPFVTEVLWQKLPRPAGAPASIMIAGYPAAETGRPDPAAIARATRLMGLIAAVRQIRSEYDVSPSKEIAVNVHTDDATLTAIIAENLFLIRSLARVGALAVAPSAAEQPRGSAAAVVEGAEIAVPLADMVDIEAELDRLGKERDKTRKLMNATEKKLSNEQFTGRAPAEVVEKEKAKLEEAKERLGRIENALRRMEEARSR